PRWATSSGGADSHPPVWTSCAKPDLRQRGVPVSARTAVSRILNDEAAADAITQDVFVRLWECPHGCDPARAALPTWLCIVARSRALDLVRRRMVRDRHVAAAWADHEHCDRLDAEGILERLADLAARWDGRGGVSDRRFGRAGHDIPGRRKASPRSRTRCRARSSAIPRPASVLSVRRRSRGRRGPRWSAIGALPRSRRRRICWTS